MTRKSFGSGSEDKGLRICCLEETRSEASSVYIPQRKLGGLAKAQLCETGSDSLGGKWEKSNAGADSSRL